MELEQSKTKLHLVEFVALMAMMTSLAALSIDGMLPALPLIGLDLGVQNPNNNQFIITVLFLGLGIGQMIYGPVSDSIGRKPTIYAGLVLFLIGCLLSIYATTFQTMLVGRLIQGIGVAGPRIVSIALIRDQYKGREMARVMSFVMAVFILVPVVAPIIGQGILMVGHWRIIFGMFLALALIVGVWFAVRQPETLTPERQVQFSFRHIGKAIREVCLNRFALGYTIAAGTISGAFVGYLSSAQQIFQEHYGLGTQFPLYFGVLALSIGCAFFANAKLVITYGMERLSRWAVQALSGISIIFFIIAYLQEGSLSLWLMMIYCMISFFCIGLLFGNLNSLAMEPLGHIAGVGASVVASISTFIAMPLGALIGYSYNNTVLPLVGGFALLGTVTMIIIRLIKS